MPSQELRNSLKSNHRLHWYLVDKVLGQGGFGITYLAHDPNLDQYVAVKEYLPMELAVRDGDNSVYPASEANGERYQWGLERFISEARTLAKFKHPAIVRVLSVFEENNTAYMVMEYERGESFQQVIDQRKDFTEQELLRIIGPLLDGLELIHNNGFIHRDIKPANIYIRRDGSPVLLDFGSARQALGEQTKSLTSIVSPGYAPFEQYYSKSDRQGPWTDIYSLAATMYRAVTGLMPMDAIDRSEAILKAEKDAFISAETLGAGKFSAQFLRAIDAGLQFSEKKRPQTVDEWRQQLGIERNGMMSYSQENTRVFADDDPISKTQFDAPSRPPGPISEGKIETQIATRVQGESLEPNELPAISNSIDSNAISAGGIPPGASQAPNSQAVGVGGQPWGKIVFASLAALIVIAVLTMGLSGPGGFVDNVKFKLAALTGSSENVQSLVAKGDRALAAGKVYQPFDGSALDYYRRAVMLDPGNTAARQGIELTAPEVLRALDDAIASGNLDSADELYKYLDSLPYKPFDLSEAAQAIEDKQLQAAAAAREQERVGEFLRAADEDMQAGRLVAPAQSNALLKFRAVLLIDAENSSALAGIEEIANVLTKRFGDELAADEFDAAENTVSQLAAIAEHSARAAELASQLKAKRDSVQQQQTKAATIAEILTQADKDLAAVRLASPRNRNAYDRYKEVLALDPDNERAKAGIEAVANKYAELSNTALRNKEADKLNNYLYRLSTIAPSHPALSSLKNGQRELKEQITAEETALALERERLRIEEEARMRQAEQQRLAMERQRQQAAEEELRRQREAEAKRLFEEEERKAQAAKAELQQSLDSDSTVVVEFDGFDDQLELYGLRKREVRADVEAELRKAGYIVKLHHEAMRIPGSRLVIIRFRANLNSASGVFSYASSIALYNDVAYWPLDRHRSKLTPLWERGNSGVAIQTELARVRKEYLLIAQRLVHEVGRAPRVTANR